MSEMPADSTPPIKRIQIAPLGHRAGRGMIYSAASIVLSRPASVLMYVMLAWYLQSDELGLVALVYSWSSLGSMITKPGFDEVMVQRTRKIDRWMNPAFWFSLLFTIVGVIVLLITGVIGSITHDVHGQIVWKPIFFWMMSIIALSTAIDSTSLIPGAMFKVRLRFAAMSALSFITVWVTALLVVIGLLAGLNVFSQPVTQLFISIGIAIYFWRSYPVRIRRNIQFRRWKYLWSLTWQRIITRALTILGNNGDYMALGFFVSSAALGSYYLAFNIMVQAQRLAGQGLFGVLMPAMSHLDIEPERQRQALINSTRMLALLTIPIGLGISAAAAPMIRLVFPSRYDDAILLTQILGAGGVGWMQLVTLQSFCAAQRRYRDELKSNLAFTIGFFAWVIPLAWMYGTLGSAFGVAMHYLTCPIYCTYYLGRGRMTISQFYRAMVRPTVAAIVAFLPVSILEFYLPDTTPYDILIMSLFATVSVVGYFGMLWIVDRHRSKALLERARGLFAKGRNIPDSPGETGVNPPAR